MKSPQCASPKNAVMRRSATCFACRRTLTCSCGADLIKKARFFGDDFEANLVYIYDAISRECPELEVLIPSNLIIGPSVVNNLGWVRGYWEIMASQPLGPADIRDEHLFVRYQGTGSLVDYDLVDKDGRVVVDRVVDPRSLGHAGYSNFNYVDWLVRCILESRNVIPQ